MLIEGTGGGGLPDVIDPPDDNDDDGIINGGGSPTPTPTNTPTVTPTLCPQVAIACIPTATSTPSPTATPTPYTGPYYTTPKPPSPYLDFQFYIDWSKVDKIDAVIDVVGLSADLISVIPATAPAAPIAQGIGIVAEGVGFGKSTIELIQGDPRSMLVSQTTDAAKATAIAFRLERMVPIPGIGSIGNLVSLGINLQPKITIEWIEP